MQTYSNLYTAAKKGALQERNRKSLWAKYDLSAKPLGDIKPKDIAEWIRIMEAAGKAPSTIRNLITLVSQTYKFAIAELGIKGILNPVPGVKLPKNRPGRDRRLEEGELERLLEGCLELPNHSLHDLIIVAVETAMLNKLLVLELARCEYIERRENVIAVGNAGTGKTHVALGLGLAACQKGLSVSFTTAAALVHELIEARDEKRLLRLQRQLAKVKLLIIDELGYVPLSPTGAELLFEVFSQRYERGTTIVTSNLPFDEWTSVFGSERLTGALLDRLTHHVHILEMNGESYRLKQSTSRQKKAKQPKA